MNEKVISILDSALVRAHQGSYTLGKMRDTVIAHITLKDGTKIDLNTNCGPERTIWHLREWGVVAQDIPQEIYEEEVITLLPAEIAEKAPEASEKPRKPGRPSKAEELAAPEAA